MDHEFYSIVERLALLEGRITPDNVKHGLNKQQKSVPQMPALFKPKTQKILGGDYNAKNPMSGYAVGSSESVEHDDEEMIEWQNSAPGEPEQEELVAVREGRVSEEATPDMLNQVKASLADYLKTAEEKLSKDKDLLDKKKQDLDLRKKDLKDLELQTKKHKELQKQKKEIEKQHKEIEAQHAELDEMEAAGVPLHITFTPEDIESVRLIDRHTKSGILKHIIGEYDGMGRDEDEDVQLSITFTPEDIEEIRDFAEQNDPSGIFDHIAYEYDQNSETISEEPNQTPGGASPDGDADPTYAQGSNNTYAESAESPVKTFQFEDGSECSIFGDEDNGFEIRRGDRVMPSRFDNLDHAVTALEVFKAKRAARRAAEENADYVEEK